MSKKESVLENIVLNVSDVTSSLTPAEIEILLVLVNKVKRWRETYGLGEYKGIFIAQDSPIYTVVVDHIEKMVNMKEVGDEAEDSDGD